LCFANVIQVKRGKLEKNALLCIFMGYNTISKAYRIHHPQTRKMIITRDVHFYKNDHWIWNNSQRIGGLWQEVNNNPSKEEEQKTR